MKYPLGKVPEKQWGTPLWVLMLNLQRWDKVEVSVVLSWGCGRLPPHACNQMCCGICPGWYVAALVCITGWVTTPGPSLNIRNLPGPDRHP